MPNIYEGKLDGKGKRVALVVSRFNDLVTGRLTSGAQDSLLRHGVADKDISIVRVPGAFEISAVCRKLAASGKYDSVIALGAVIRGETPHFDYVAAEAAKGVAQAAFESGIPIIFGVLTTDSLEQALERAGAKAGNKGSEAATAALEMMDLYGGGLF
jgi:6,7-dimethyl-8-ribityllumazine synthase